jgi:hypothetical protein
MRTPRLLWIDSICINRNDKEEKVSQIQLMKNTYSNAFFVSVCLQPTPIAGNEAADYIKAYQFPGVLRLSENDKEVDGETLRARYGCGYDPKVALALYKVFSYGVINVFKVYRS